MPPSFGEPFDGHYVGRPVAPIPGSWGFHRSRSTASQRAYCRPVSTAANDRAAERVAQVCDGRHDTRELRLAVLEEIRRVIGFDAYAWLLTDPETEVGCAPLADVPCLPELPWPIRLKYLTAVNRWTTLDAPVALLLAATDGQPERSRIWRELLVDYGVSDVASVVFRDRFGCWAFLDLWRIGAAAPFTAEEATFLSCIALPVAEGASEVPGPHSSTGSPHQGIAAGRSSSRFPHLDVQGPDSGGRAIPQGARPARRRPSTDSRRGLQRGRSAARPRGGGRRASGLGALSPVRWCVGDSVSRPDRWKSPVPKANRT